MNNNVLNKIRNNNLLKDPKDLKDLKDLNVYDIAKQTQMLVNFKKIFTSKNKPCPKLVADVICSYLISSYYSEDSADIHSLCYKAIKIAIKNNLVNFETGFMILKADHKHRFGDVILNHLESKRKNINKHIFNEKRRDLQRLDDPNLSDFDLILIMDRNLKDLEVLKKIFNHKSFNIHRVTFDDFKNFTPEIQRSLLKIIPSSDVYFLYEIIEAIHLPEDKELYFDKIIKIHKTKILS